MSDSEMSESEKGGNGKSAQKEGKIQRTPSSMVKQMQLSDDEVKYRMEHFENVDVVKEYLKYLKCTKCSMNFQRLINRGDKVGIHPLLGVLMCDSCCDYYGDGNFSLDSEGEDKYCRWCGEGGTIFACSKCICGFCDDCIKKHFGEEGLEEVEKDDDWICYFCNPKPLWYLRSICSLAKEAARNKRDHLKKNKQGRSVKKKRRKTENSDFDNTSSDSSSCSNSSRSSSNSNKKPKRRKLSKFPKTRKREASSSEEEKENHVNSKKRGSKSKKQTPLRDATKESSESDTKDPKKSKNSDEENEDLEFLKKKTNFLQKLKSIWRLTQTITEVGLSSSRKKMKIFGNTERFKTMELLKQEHDDLKSCINVLLSSLSTASNSVNSIQEDLTFDMTNDETESFRSQEIKLKTFGDKFHEESDDKSSVDSENDSFRKELKSKDRRKKQRVSENRQSIKKKRRGNSNCSEEGEDCERGNKSISLFSDSGSDKQKKNKKGDSKVKDEKDDGKRDRDSCEESGPVKPLLKVKSFARMLDENIYDKNKTKNEKSPVVIDLYDIDTDESENEMKKKTAVNNKTSNKSLCSELEKRHENGPKEDDNCVNGKENKSTSDAGQENSNNESTNSEMSTKDDTKTEKSLVEATKNETKSKTNKKDSLHDESDKESSDEDDKSKDDRAVTKVKKRKKTKSPDKNQKESSGNEESSSSDDEKESLEAKKKKGKKTKKLSDDKDEKSKRVSKLKETANGTENNNRQLSPDEGNSGKDSSEEINGKTKERDDRDKEKEMNSKVSGEGEKEEKEKKKPEESEEEQPKESDDEGQRAKQMDKTMSDNEVENKEESSGSEKEKVKKSSSEDKNNDSSESDSSSGGEAENRITRSHKKELKTSFEKFKRKRERFLKSSKESSQPEVKEEIKAKEALDSSESENEKKESETKSKRQKKKRILASSDEENDAKKATSSEESEKENHEESDKSDPEVTKPSSGDSSSEEEVETKKRKRIRKRKDSSDSSEEENKRKKKRRDSSSESSEDEKTKKKKKGRKNIKKILKKDSLQVETKEALKNESERKKRLKERQKLFEELFPQKEGEDEPKQLILDFNAETKEPLVSVHKKLVKKLKPHQMKGVKFMWDNCFESVQKLEEESGSGCILAHCMGLGKTLQVITLVHTVMTHDLGVNTVLIVCPLSTVSNWIREFETWLAKIHTEPITLYDLLKYKKQDERIFHLKDWHENGGVLVLSYDLFRNLTKVLPKNQKKKKPKYRQVFETALLDPGPDLVVCDEGHLLKNEDTTLSKCMSRVKTSRRIVLTGTPLQNNLVEYHCMVQFVKPNILGTKKEFCNRFVNPINNGQFEDSTELDVKIMKRRSHVLHSMLDGCIQRFDYSVLTPFLPEKQEYVLTIALTEAQAKAYVYFINNLSAKSFGNSRVASLFHDYHSLQRIWTHPRTMLMQSEREMQKDVLEKDSEGSLKDFIVSSDEESERTGSESSDDSEEEVVPKKRILRSNANDPEVKRALEEEEKLQNKHWWDDFYDEKAYDDLRESNKLILLFSLLKSCAQKKDKILVFSQSLYSLDLIEYFLSKINENGKKNDETLCGHRDTWELGSDYFRLDGSTNSDTRAMWCKYFNKESNTRARLFLISTKAGGLGINLYGANRVIIFDASWNPSHDLQSIFRVYRFGQKKPCYIYRFLAEATMEEKIYERQVTKLSLAHRVVDEHQIERHYSMGNLQELYTFQPTPKDQRKVPKLPKDPVLADLLAEHKEIIVGYHEHDSLLENKQEEELSEEERKAAWKEYEEEKIQKAFNINPMLLPQGPFPQGMMGTPGFNPAVMNQGNMPQSFINPLYLQANYPLEALQRGLRVGVTPLPGESAESYITRIYNREAWVQVGQAQSQEI